MNERPSWSIEKAAAECGVSRDTIKRRRSRGDFPNAYKNTSGHWLIPITDLIAAGLRPGKPTEGWGTAPVQPQNAPPVALGQRPTRETELEHENQLLKAQLDAEKALRAAAEQNAQDLRNSLRILESGHPTPPQTSTRNTQPEPPTKRRRKWFTR